MKTLSEMAHALCVEIEKLPAGDQQTTVSMMAADLLVQIQAQPPQAAPTPTPSTKPDESSRTRFPYTGETDGSVGPLSV